MLGTAAEIVRLWVPFPLLPPVSWLIGSCGGTSSSPLYGSNVGEGVGGLGSFQRRIRPFGMMLSSPSAMLELRILKVSNFAVRKVRIEEQCRIILSLIRAPVGEGDDILNAELSWPRSDEIWLCISRGGSQVVTGKGPMAVALGARDYCKIWGWLRLKLLSEGILHSIERDTCIITKRIDCKRKGWTARGKDGQQKDISAKESPKGPPDLSRVAQPTAARGGILDKFPPPQSQLKLLVRAARQCEGNSRGGQAS
jgi:hypothetical protein